MKFLNLDIPNVNLDAQIPILFCTNSTFEHKRTACDIALYVIASCIKQGVRVLPCWIHLIMDSEQLEVIQLLDKDIDLLKKGKVIVLRTIQSHIQPQ